MIAVNAAAPTFGRGPGLRIRRNSTLGLPPYPHYKKKAVPRQVDLMLLLSMQQLNNPSLAVT